MHLKIKDVSFYYDSIKALDDVSLEVHEGEILGVIGPNGSGKSTLLKCIDGILKPETGCVLIDDKNILMMDRREIARKIGVVPQNSTTHFPFTVFDIVLMGRTPHMGKLEREDVHDIEIAKNSMKITDTIHLAHRLIDEISGGERQRVIIARALTQEPEILLLDEPTLHLDLNHQLEILDLVRELAKKNRLIVVLASHDLNLVNRYCDKLILLKSGRIYAGGEPRDVLTRRNIKDVYRVEVEINYNRKTDSLVIVPLAKIDAPDA